MKSSKNWKENLKEKEKNRNIKELKIKKKNKIFGKNVLI